MNRDNNNTKQNLLKQKEEGMETKLPESFECNQRKKEDNLNNKETLNESLYLQSNSFYFGSKEERDRIAKYQTCNDFKEQDDNLKLLSPSFNFNQKENFQFTFAGQGQTKVNENQNHLNTQISYFPGTRESSNVYEEANKKLFNLDKNKLLYLLRQIVFYGQVCTSKPKNFFFNFILFFIQNPFL